MKLLKEIIEQWGFVTAEQCAELAQYFPQTELIIQWGAMPREPMHAAPSARRVAAAALSPQPGDFSIRDGCGRHSSRASPHNTQSNEACAREEPPAAVNHHPDPD